MRQISGGDAFYLFTDKESRHQHISALYIYDPDFDLEYHVRHIALPKPGDWRQLCILLSRLHARSRSLIRCASVVVVPVAFPNRPPHA